MRTLFVIICLSPIFSASYAQVLFASYDNLTLTIDNKSLHLKGGVLVDEKGVKVDGFVTGYGSYILSPIDNYFECEVKNGLRDGECRVYDDNGSSRKLYSLGQYKGGKLNGLYRIYNPSGTYLSDEYYTNGTLNGSSVIYLNNSSPMAVKEYKNGALIKQSAYRFDGSISYTAELKNGEITSVLCYSSDYKNDDGSKLLTPLQLQEFKATLNEECYKDIQ